VKLIAEDSFITEVINRKPKRQINKKGEVFDMEIATKERQLD
jgi:hypothetical protein